MTQTIKNIVLVTSEFPPQPGGIGNHAYHLGLALTKEGYHIRVITDQRSETGEEERMFDAGLPFEVIRVKRFSWRALMYFKRLWFTFKGLGTTDLIIATGKFSLWNVALGTLFVKRKSLAVIHGTEVNFKPFLLRKSVAMSLKRFDQIVSVSRYTKSLVQPLDLEITVIPNGIHLEDWKAPDVNESQLQGTPKLTTVGRVSSRKGQLQVIKHLPQLLRRFPELQYHCIGISTEAEKFIQIAEDLGVASHVTFYGSVSHQGLKEMLSQTDIFVMLSSESTTGDVEGYGIALLEANSMGIPTIGSKGCGIEDAILDGRSGILVDAQDGDTFCEAVETILENPNYYRSEAAKWAKAHDWSEVVKSYVAVFGKLEA